MGILASLILGFFIGYLGIFMISHINNQIKRDYKYYIKVKNIGKFSKWFKQVQIPIIKVTVDGVRYPFVLDSGSNINIIDVNLVKALDNTEDKVEGGRIQGISGAITGSSKITKEFKYNNQTFTEEFTVLDMDSINCNLKKKGVQIYGILGSNFFKEYQWNLDFDRMVVWKKVK